MPSAYKMHSDFGYICLSPNLRRKVGLALALIVSGSIAGASGIFVQMADEPNTNGASMIAAIPLNSSATLSTSIVLPASPAASAPDSRRDFALPSNSAQAAPVDAMTTAATEPAATEPAATATTAATEPAATATTAVTEPPVTATTAVTAASKKPQKTARSQNRRDRDLYDAYALRQQRADYGRGRVSGNNFSGAGW
jgi:hypothetical protein